jgi:hypothetical protein
LLVDQLGRTLFNFIQQTLTALLILLAEMNRSEAAHTKLTDHPSRYLYSTLNVIRSSGSHRREQHLLSGTTTQQQRNLVFEIFAFLHEAIALRQ